MLGLTDTTMDTEITNTWKQYIHSAPNLGALCERLNEAECEAIRATITGDCASPRDWFDLHGIGLGELPVFGGERRDTFDEFSWDDGYDLLYDWRAAEWWVARRGDSRGSLSGDVACQSGAAGAGV